ncbi:MAG: sigma-70 family RNA polymerase sigma factor [Pedobacter sp.]
MEKSITDIELWQSIKCADEKAFKILMDRYWSPLYNKAFVRINKEDVSKDLVQEILISIWVNKEKLPDDVLPKAYLFTALKYKILNFVSYSTVRLNHANMVLAMQQVENNSTPEDIINIKELRTAVLSSTEKMPPGMKEVFELNYKEGLSITEIAIEKGISSQSVKNYLYEAKCILKKHLSSQLSSEQIAGLLIVILMED